MNARSSWRSARTSSPPNPIFSFGISRGPASGVGRCAGAPRGLAIGAPGGAAGEERGGSAAPFIRELIPGTEFAAFAGSVDFGDPDMGLRE